MLAVEELKSRGHRPYLGAFAGQYTYPGVEVLADGTFVLTTYGHWTPSESTYILSARVTLREIDELANPE